MGHDFPKMVMLCPTLFCFGVVAWSWSLASFLSPVIASSVSGDAESLKLVSELIELSRFLSVLTTWSASCCDRLTNAWVEIPGVPLSPESPCGCGLLMSCPSSLCFNAVTWSRSPASLVSAIAIALRSDVLLVCLNLRPKLGIDEL